MNTLKLITSFLLTILPLALLIRDWKFHDKRTRKHHKITRIIIVFWCIGSIAATFFVWYDSAQIKELINGKNILITKLDKYQEDLKNKQHRINELENKSNIIQSLELHVFVNIKTLESQATDRETSAGLSNAIALFAKDKTRYRFVTDFRFTIQQITPTVKRIEFIYRPEDPVQILGKQIDFLENMEKFVCNYQTFLRKVNITDNLGSTVNINVFVNGIDVITLRDLNCNAGVLSGGQAALSINDSFKKIPERYIVKIKEKSIGD